MINEILAKIPEATRDRLERELSNNFDDSVSYIHGVCAGCYDCGVIDFDEYEILYRYYSDRLYNGGNAQ